MQNSLLARWHWSNGTISIVDYNSTQLCDVLWNGLDGAE